MLAAQPPPTPVNPQAQHAAIARAAARRVRRKRWTTEHIFLPGAQGVSFQSGRAPGLPPDALSAYQSDANKKIIYSDLGEGITKDKSGLAHEMGHMLTPLMTPADQARFTRLLGLPAGEWNRGTGQRGGSQSPSEWFADWYSLLATHTDPRNEGIGSYAKMPNRKQLRRFALALARFGRRNSLSAYKEPSWPSSP